MIAIMIVTDIGRDPMQNLRQVCVRPRSREVPYSGILFTEMTSVSSECGYIK